MEANFHILPTFPPEYFVSVPEEGGESFEMEGGQHVDKIWLNSYILPTFPLEDYVIIRRKREVLKWKAGSIFIKYA